MGLPSEIREEILETHDTPHDLLLKWLPKVEGAFSNMNMQTKWADFIDKFDDTVIYGLEMCSDALSRQRPERTISNDDRTNILETINDLISDLDNQKFPPKLKVLIYEHLRLIRNAIEEYEIRGIDAIKGEVHKVIGSVVLDPTPWDDTKDTKFGKNFWEAMNKLVILTAAYGGLSVIGTDVVHLLSHLNQ